MSETKCFLELGSVEHVFTSSSDHTCSSSQQCGYKPNSNTSQSYDQEISTSQRSTLIYIPCVSIYFARIIITLKLILPYLICLTKQQVFCDLVSKHGLRITFSCQYTLPRNFKKSFRGTPLNKVGHHCYRISRNR